MVDKLPKGAPDRNFTLGMESLARYAQFKADGRWMSVTVDEDGRSEASIQIGGQDDETQFFSVIVQPDGQAEVSWC